MSFNSAGQVIDQDPQVQTSPNTSQFRGIPTPDRLESLEQDMRTFRANFQAFESEVNSRMEALDRMLDLIIQNLRSIPRNKSSSGEAFPVGTTLHQTSDGGPAIETVRVIGAATPRTSAAPIQTPKPEGQSSAVALVHPQLKIFDLRKYNGKRKEGACEQWCRDASAHLRTLEVLTDTTLTDRQQVIYLTQHFRGTARKWYYTLTVMADRGLLGQTHPTNVSELFALLQRNFW